MKQTLLISCLITSLVAITVRIASAEDSVPQHPVNADIPVKIEGEPDVGPAEPPVSAEERSDLHQVLLYIPNRILDFLDIFRIRARIGPGLGLGIRATKYAQVYLGSYASIYGGLPGPRMRQLPKSPIGLETYSGAALSVLDGTVDGGYGPDYSPTEVGVNLHLAIIGIDVEIDPVEIVDFVGGIATFDLRDDDY